MWRYTVAVVISFCFIFEIYAINFPDKPSGDIYYADKAGILSSAAKKQINYIAKQLWKEKKIPIYLVTINSLPDQAADSANITQYALSLGKIWALGKKGKDLSVLFIVDKLDSTAAIQFGPGWDSSYSSQGTKILNKSVYPYLKDQKYAQGAVAGIISLDALLRNPSLANSFALGATVEAKTQLISHSSGWLLVILLVASGILLWHKFKRWSK